MDQALCNSESGTIYKDPKQGRADDFANPAVVWLEDREMMHEAFLRAILENPDDDSLRLVYADWLEEHGQPERAEFIRVQIALARQCEGSPGRLPLEAHERDLLACHQNGWLGDLRPLLKRWTFRRGFLEAVAVPASVYLQHAAIPCPPTVRRFEVDLDGFEVPTPVLEVVPPPVAWENRLLPLGFRGRVLVLAMQDPGDTDYMRKLQFILNRDVEPVAASGEQILEAMERQYGPPREWELVNLDLCCFVDVAMGFASEPRDVEDDPSPVAHRSN